MSCSPAARKSNVWAPEAKLQPNWAVVAVRSTTPELAKVSRPSTSASTSPPVTPVTLADRTEAVTVLATSTSVKVSVPEVDKAASVSVRDAVRPSPFATVMTGASFAPVMVTVTSCVTVALEPSVMVTR